MINLNNRRNLESIARKYLERLKQKRMNPSDNAGRIYFIHNMERIVLAKPEKFDEIEMEFIYIFNTVATESFDSFITYMIGQYKAMCKEHGNWLAKELNIRVCPYCNRQYTFTFKNSNTEKKTRPEFDHFYNKSEYPFLALSFYNLVPSCHTCNHIKGIDSIKIHPYEKGFGCKFQIEHTSTKVLDKSNLLLLNESQFRISLNHSADELENINVFGLKELYNQHKDYVREIMDKTVAYDSHAKEALINSFQGAGYSPEQVHDFVWGRYLSETEHEKRPLSKLTRDVLEQLDII